jgi:hypothetical protein
LEEISAELRLAFDHTLAYGNYDPHACEYISGQDLTADVMMLDLSARAFSSVSLDVDLVAQRYRQLPSAMNPALKILIHIGE